MFKVGFSSPLANGNDLQDVQRDAVDLTRSIVKRSGLVIVAVCFLSWLLSTASRSILMNIPISVALLWSVRWAIGHYDIYPKGYAAALLRRGASDPSLSTRGGLDPDTTSKSSGASTAAAAAIDAAPSSTPGAPAKPNPRSVLEAVESAFRPAPGDDAHWKQHVGSGIIVDAWERVCGSIVQEFIYDLWYGFLTDDREFPAEVRKTLNCAFGELCLRAQKIDLRTLLVRDTCRVLREQLQIYRATCQAVGLDRKVPGGGGMSWAAREQALRAAMAQTGSLHPALASAVMMRKYLRRISEGVCCCTLEARDTQRPMLRYLIREIFANCALLPICQQGTPAIVNALVLSLIPAPANEDAETQRTETQPAGVYQAAIGQRANRSQLLEQEHLARKAQAALERKPLDASPDLPAVAEDGAALLGADAGADGPSLSSPSASAVRAAGASAESMSRRKEKKSGRTALSTPKKGKGFVGPPRAQVVAAEMVTEGKNVFVAYKIRVNDDAEEWTVARRFRNFELFHRRMRHMPGYTATLPPKRLLFHNLSVEFVEERRVRLHAYLQDVLSDVHLCSSWEVVEFLKPLSILYDINEDKPGAGFFKKGLPSPTSRPLAAEENATSTAANAAAAVATDRRTGPSTSTSSAQPPAGGLGSKKTPATSTRPHVEHVRAHSAGAGSLHAKAASSGPGREDAPVGGAPEDRVAARLDLIGPDTWEVGSSLSEPLDGLIDEVFQLKSRDWFRRQVVAVARQALSLLAGDSLDKFLESQLRTLQQEHTLARVMLLIHARLWPNGVWYQTAEMKAAAAAAQSPARGTPSASTSTSSPASSSAEPPPRPAAPRASFEGLPGLDVHAPSLDGPQLRDQRAQVFARMMGPGVSRSLVSLLGRTAYEEGMQDVFGMLQSPSFVSQLTLSLMDVAVSSLFPELKFLVQEARNGNF